MKNCIRAFALFALLVGFTGCLSLGDSHEVYPPTLGRELGDLKTSLDRGAISPQEYEQQKAQLMSGNHPRTRELFSGGPEQHAPRHDVRHAPQQFERQYAAPQYSTEQAQYEQPQFDPQMQQQQYQQPSPQQPQYIPQNTMQPPVMPQQQQQQQVMELPSDGWH